MSLIIEALSSMNYTAPDQDESPYVNSDNVRVPRVTEILSRMMHKDALMYWANALGFKGLRYKTVLDQAAHTGTLAHAAIERFLKKKLKTEDNIPFLGFLSWYDEITITLNLPIEPILIEKRLACRWFGGTLDALLKIGNKIYLVDFKTSNHVTFSYFCQLAAYRFMLARVLNIEIDGVIVLQLDKTEPGFNEYLLDFSIQEHADFMLHCEETFLSLVYGFYNVVKAEEQFKKIFKGRCS